MKTILFYRTRKAKLTKYYKNGIWVNEEIKVIFHGFFQYKDEYSADVIAVIEFENGIIQRVDLDYLVFEKDSPNEIKNVSKK